MVEYIKSNNNYYYKVHKNGNKTRVSKEEYYNKIRNNKLIGGHNMNNETNNNIVVNNEIIYNLNPKHIYICGFLHNDNAFVFKNTTNTINNLKQIQENISNIHIVCATSNLNINLITNLSNYILNETGIKSNLIKYISDNNNNTILNLMGSTKVILIHNEPK